MPDEESMIEDLREIETKLREIKEYRKANTIDLFIRYSTYCKIPKQKIKDKIDEAIKEIMQETCWEGNTPQQLHKRQEELLRLKQELLEED